MNQSISEEFEKITKDKIREEAEKATSEMLRSIKEDDLSEKERDEWYGYIRGVRDLVYALNCQQNGESKTHQHLVEALQYLKK